MMHILQLEIPETFTTTTQVPNTAVAEEICEAGHRYTSIDLNQLYWQWLLQRYSRVDFKEALELVQQSYRDIESAVNSAAETFDLPITEDGLQLPDEILTRSNYLVLLAEHEAFIDYCEVFFEDVLSPLLQELQPDLVSWGVSGANPLAFSIGLTSILRDRLDADLPIGIGRHTTENFSLRLRKEQLKSSGHLELFFDFVVFEEENYVSAVLGFAHKDDIENSHPRSVLDIGWLKSSQPAGPGMTVCRMPLSRNRCYWDRCTFCVQVKTQSSEFKFHDRNEYDRSLKTISALHEYGFRYFLFEDQAVSPRNIRRLCQYLEDNQIQIQWTIRTIADADFDESLVQRMAANGCAEVLFGLETVTRETASLMGKISRDNSVSEIGELLDRFTRNNISVFLNVIYGFPTESNETFKETLNAVKQFREVSNDILVQFNRFTLYVRTDIYDDPSAYGVSIDEDPETDLLIAVDYRDQFGRDADTDLSALVPDEAEIDCQVDLIELKLRSGSVGFIDLCRKKVA